MDKEEIITFGDNEIKKIDFTACPLVLFFKGSRY